MTGGYWRFFPASEDGWGRIPAWGHARQDDLRVFGYVPMASHVVLMVLAGDAAPAEGFILSFRRAARPRRRRA